MEITLEQLFDMQKELDARIIREKELEGVDLLPNTVLALQVEIAELANEWRGFKHWSNDQKPRFERKCHACSGEGGFILGDGPEDSEACGYCEGTGIEERPLLEEYADCVSFFLQIARQRDLIEHMYIYEDAIEDLREKGLDGGITGALLECKYWLAKFHMEKDRDEKIEKAFGYTKQVYCFKNSWFVFIAIGVVGLGFTWEQIAEAYVSKNRVNHERQSAGY